MDQTESGAHGDPRIGARRDLAPEDRRTHGRHAQCQLGEARESTVSFEVGLVAHFDHATSPQPQPAPACWEYKPTAARGTRGWPAATVTAATPDQPHSARQRCTE